MQVGDAGHRLVVERDDEIARQQTGVRGGAALVDAEEPRAARLIQPQAQRDAARDRRRRRADADIGAAHAPVTRDLAGDEMGGVGGDREADALRAHDDRGVDADDLAGRGDQRPAGIAGVQRRVGLHDVLDHAAGARLQRAAERRDDACGHRRVEAEGIADGDGDLAAPEPRAVAEPRRRQRRRFRRRAAAPDRCRDRRRARAPAIRAPPTSSARRCARLARRGCWSAPGRPAK